jgi:type IV secretory pathway TraG/TraD family ATPase VirD4
MAAAACTALTAAALGPAVHAFSAAAAAAGRGARVPDGSAWLARRLAVCLAVKACAAEMRAEAAGALRDTRAGLYLALFAWAAWLVLAASSRGDCEKRRPAAGTARYARRGELRRLGTAAGAWFPLGYLPPGAVVRYLSRLRLCRRWLGPWIGPQVRLPAAELARHVLVLGLTGARKTTAVVFPALLEAARHGVSAVAFDLKYGEADSLARVAAEWRRWGRDVQIFAPLDRATLRWNPLADCRTMGDAYHLASLLFDEVDPSSPDLLYWVGAEQHVCAVLAHALSADGRDAALGRLRVLCASGPDAVRGYIRAHPAGDRLAPALGAFHAMMPKDQAGILQGIASRLEAWGDDRVAAATSPAPSWQRLDLVRLRRDPVLLIVGVPQAALGRLRWLCHFLLKSIAACLLAPRPEDEQVPVVLVLEELTAWGALPGLVDHLATYRSRGVSVLATVQSDAQGEHVYGPAGWAAIAANLVTKVYFPSMSDRDAERLSRALGTAGGEDLARSRAWGANGRRTGEQRRPVPVPLARPEDVRAWARPPDEALVRFDRLPPARLWCPPYTARPEYDRSVPDGAVTTSELAVYHHLREIAMRPPAPALAAFAALAPCEPAAPPSQAPVGPSTVPAPRSPDPPSPAIPHLALPVAAASAAASSATGPPVAAPSAAAASAAAASAAGPSAAARPEASPMPLSPPMSAPLSAPVSGEEDARQLDHLVAQVLSEDGRGSGLTCVRSGDRVVEVRLPPDSVARCCGGAAAMHRLARRWSTLRWVRRVRPTFVLTRRALDRLDRDLRARLERIDAEQAGTGTGAAETR